MERFLVFVWQHFYPRGGWNDYVGTFTRRDEATACLKGQFEGSADWGQIVDTENGAFDTYAKADRHAL